MMLARLAAFGFAIIQALLLLRLALPFLRIPSTLNDWVPALIQVTDLLVAPFQPIAKTFDLKTAAQTLPAFGGAFSGYVDRIDGAVVVAMIGWGLIAFVVTLILTLVARGR
jgi:hypothetical protein